MREVPVLIVGAGPAGLMASLLLEQMGVETCVVERRPSWQRAPAAHVVNARTLEICRAAGVDMEALAKAAVDPADGGRVYWVTKLGGRVIGGLPFEQQGDDQLAVTPTPLRNLSQNRFEPLLISALQAHGREPEWNRQWESMEQDADGVVSRVRDLQSDTVSELRSRYLIAADGAGSRVRKSLGIELNGPDRLQSFIMIHLRAALRDQVGDPPGVLQFALAGDTGGGAFVIHDPDAEAVFMAPFDPESESVESYDVARCEAIVRGALEDPELPFEIEAIGDWTMTAQVANEYRRGRVFLVGDSAHRFPPTGGLGLNSGVQDAHNLAWKLREVLSGRSPDRLLDTYQSERQPVAQSNADQSLRNALKLIEITVALGVTDALEDPIARVRETLADPEGLARVQAAIANQAEHFDMPGLQLGFAYAEGAVARGEDDPLPGPIDPRRFVPSGAPGHRLPHAWVEDAGRRLSLLDWVQPGRFLLLAGPGGAAWLDAAASLDEERIVARALEAAAVHELDAWLEQAGIDVDGALLVRPDQHVAWRSRSSVAEPAGTLEAALLRVTGAPD